MFVAENYHLEIGNHTKLKKQKKISHSSCHTFVCSGKKYFDRYNFDVKILLVIDNIFHYTKVSTLPWGEFISEIVCHPLDTTNVLISLGKDTFKIICWETSQIMSGTFGKIPYNDSVRYYLSSL